MNARWLPNTIVALLGVATLLPARVSLGEGQTPVKVQLEIQPGHLWLPPFALERVGRTLHAVITGDQQQPPPGEFVLVGLREGKEVSRSTLKWIVKPMQVWYPHPMPCHARIPLDAQPSEVVLLWKSTPQAAPVELARQAIGLEADAIARPDRVTNPVDLGAILPPADWLLLAGGQKAVVEVAALSRNRDSGAGSVTAWYASAPQQKAVGPIALQQRKKAHATLAIEPCSSTLERDVLHVSITGADGKELWQKQISTMIVPKPPANPAFGAVETKLRYDAPVLSFNKGKRTWLKYDELWQSKFHDVVVFLPNGGRFIFWRGANYAPFWAGRQNTALCYEWAERLSPNVGFTDCPEPLADKELRYSHVEILESTAARVHVRWTYQSCDFNYKVNGDLCSEDFYFYPDGFGTRAVTLTHIPEAVYELAEFIIITPQGAYPMDVLPANQGDILALNGAKMPLRFPFPERQEAWKKLAGAPAMYRIRLHEQDPQAVVSFSPTLTALPIPYSPFFDDGMLVTRMYWAAIWPLTRGLMTPWDVSEFGRVSPSTNCLMTFAAEKPKPVRNATVTTKDGLGQMKPMRVETFAWLIGTSAAGDEALLHWAQSFSQPPVLELQGARLETESYASERRALRLQVENKNVAITIRPAGRCVNPVFELQGAPKTLVSVTLGDKILDDKQYAWDGRTLWISANLAQPTSLRLLFNPEK
jgi:hypothetical protein